MLLLLIPTSQHRAPPAEPYYTTLRGCLWQGSGWGWLGYNKATSGLEIATCANQDPLAKAVSQGTDHWGDWLLAPAACYCVEARPTSFCPFCAAQQIALCPRVARCSCWSALHRVVWTVLHMWPYACYPLFQSPSAWLCSQGLVPLLGVDVWEVSRRLSALAATASLAIPSAADDPIDCGVDTTVADTKVHGYHNNVGSSSSTGVALELKQGPVILHFRNSQTPELAFLLVSMHVRACMCMCVCV